MATGVATHAEEAEAIWAVNALLLVGVTGAQTGGQLTVIEARGGEGYASPLHVHRHADEAFVILEGEFRFECGENLYHLGPGSVVFGPRGVPHRFRLDSDTGRLIDIHTPSGFENFIRAVGKPAKELRLPPPEDPPDPEALRKAAAQHGIDVVGPPLAPLTSVSSVPH